MICINDFTAKNNRQLVLQVIFFVNKCEAMFSTEIFKCTCIKSLLEIYLASSVKLSIVLK